MHRDQSASQLQNWYIITNIPGPPISRLSALGAGEGREHQNKISKENEALTWDHDPLISSWKWTYILKTSKNHLLVELSLLVVVSLLFPRSSISHHSLYKTWQELLVLVCSPERGYKFVNIRILSHHWMSTGWCILADIIQKILFLKCRH